MACGQLVDATEHGQRRRRGQEAEIVVHGHRFYIPGDIGVGKNGLDFRAKQELLLTSMKVKRLDADAIPRQREQLPALVPNCKGIVAGNTLEQTVQPPFFVAVHQHFGVGMVCTKLVACRLKFFA